MEYDKIYPEIPNIILNWRGHNHKLFFVIATREPATNLLTLQLRPMYPYCGHLKYDVHLTHAKKGPSQKLAMLHNVKVPNSPPLSQMRGSYFQTYHRNCDTYSTKNAQLYKVNLKLTRAPKDHSNHLRKYNNTIWSQS